VTQGLDFLGRIPDCSRPETSAIYDELPLWSAMFGLLLLDEVPLAHVSRALDVGCGTGFPLLELAERLGPASHVDGIDPWTGALRRAEEKRVGRGIANVSLHLGSAADMPFEPASFDLIVSNLGVNNFEDRHAAIAECRRTARLGGRIALTTNLQGHMLEFYELFAEVLAGRGDPEALAALQAHVTHRATVGSLRDLLEEGGFTLTRVVERTMRMRFASGLALMNHYFIRLGFLGSWKSIVAGRENEVFGELVSRLEHVARQRGVLALTIPAAYVEAVAG
jgi:ubiquinone/menaquinone biosynthesis C-methylase UbiE